MSFLFGGDKDPAPAAAPAPVAEEAPKTEDVATRDPVGPGARQAAGAEIASSDNEADTLGYVTPKRKSASRNILG